MHCECIILRMNIIVFWIIGPCNLTGGYRGFSQDMLLLSLMACKDRSRMILQNIHNHVPEYMGRNLDNIMKSHHSEHLKYCTKRY
jgi:hypothetical protein